MEIFQSTRGDEGNIGIERDIDILVDIYNLDSIETWLDDVAMCFVSFDERVERRNYYSYYFSLRIFISMIISISNEARIKFENGLYHLFFFKKIILPLSAPIFPLTILYV